MPLIYSLLNSIYPAFQITQYLLHIQDHWMNRVPLVNLILINDEFLDRSDDLRICIPSPTETDLPYCWRINSHNHLSFYYYYSSSDVFIVADLNHGPPQDKSPALSIDPVPSRSHADHRMKNGRSIISIKSSMSIIIILTKRQKSN